MAPSILNMPPRRPRMGRRRKIMGPGWPVQGSGSTPPNMVNENRYGKFAILHEYLDSADPAVMAFMRKVLIVKAESHYQSKTLRYEGYSDMFDRLQTEYTAPEYTIKINVSTVPEHLPLKQHSKWIEEKCANINESQENNVFFARSAIKNHYYMKTPSRSGIIESQYVCFSVEKMTPLNTSVASTDNLAFFQTGGAAKISINRSNVNLARDLDKEIESIMNGLSPTVADMSALNQKKGK